MNFITRPERQDSVYPSQRPLPLNGREFSCPVEYYIPFYSNLSQQALSGLLDKAKTVTYLRHGTLDDVSPQSPDNAVCIVFSGKVTIVSGESTATILIQDSDSCVSEIAVLPGELEPASIVTFDKAVFAMVAKPEVKNWLKDYPDVVFNLNKRDSPSIMKA